MNHEHAHELISASDARIAALIARSRRYDITPPVSIRPFDALAESIAYQQLNGKAAAKIWGRVRGLYSERKWLDPEKVLATPDETLRATGLSRAKIAAVKDLAAKTIDGTVPSGRALLRMSDEEIIARLTAVRHRSLDSRDASSFRSCSPGCLAGQRLRGAQRFRENLWTKETAHAEAADEVWREVAAVPFCRRLVFLASAG